MLAKDPSQHWLVKSVRSHLFPFLPGEAQRFVYKVWRDGLRKTCNSYIAAGACCLVYLLKRIWVRDHIVVYPHPLRFEYVTWQLAMLSGYKIVHQTTLANNNRQRLTVANIYHHDADYQTFDPEAINGRCVDITKRKVDEIFRNVFGYSLTIDPTCHVGQAVCKSNANGRHDGVIVDCPIDERRIDESAVYQKLIDNTFGNGLVRDFRVCIIGDRISEVEDKQRDEKFRFKARNITHIRAAEAQETFDEEEQRKIILFCKQLGLEIGELDVLRDHSDGRLYIVDANKTATSLARKRPWFRFWCWYRRARVFRSYVRCRVQLGYEAGRRSADCGGLPVVPDGTETSGTRTATGGDPPEPSYRRWRTEMSREKHAGTGDNQATDRPELELRTVRPSEIDALLDFEERALRELPDKRFVYFHERSYFEALLAGAGVVIAVFTQDGIIGVSACELQPSAEKVAKLCPFLPSVERGAVAINGATLIDQRHRSRGLGRRLHTERLRLTRERGCLHSIGIIFLLNHRSLALTFRMGRFVRGTWIDQDGPNFVTHHDLRRTQVRRSSPNHTVELVDFDGHRAAIADGLWGYKLQGDDQRPSLVYAYFDYDGGQ